MKKVLFVCIENSCRSQMAEGFASHLGSDVIKAQSAGSRPSGIVSTEAVRVMAEAGVDISSAKSKGFGELTFKEFDYVITLGCGDSCPFVSAHQHIEWQIEDPKGKDIETFRRVRETIRGKVEELVSNIKSC